MSAWRKVRVLVLSTILVLAIAALSRVPYTPGDPEDALVRLAWRYRGETDRECRPITAEERARLPIHMQRDTICESGSTPYRLQVSLDGEPVTDTVVTAAGARQDRPMYVFREIPMTSGTHQIDVTFAPELPTSGLAALESLSLSRTFALQGRQVALVTYDQAADALVLRSP